MDQHPHWQSLVHVGQPLLPSHPSWKCPTADQHYPFSEMVTKMMIRAYRGGAFPSRCPSQLWTTIPYVCNWQQIYPAMLWYWSHAHQLLQQKTAAQAQQQQGTMQPLRTREGIGHHHGSTKKTPTWHFCLAGSSYARLLEQPSLQPPIITAAAATAEALTSSAKEKRIMIMQNVKNWIENQKPKKKIKQEDNHFWTWRRRRTASNAAGWLFLGGRRVKGGNVACWKHVAKPPAPQVACFFRHGI